MLQQIVQESAALVHALDRLRESGIPVPRWLAQLRIAGEHPALWWRSNLGNPTVVVEWLHDVHIENITAWTGSLGGALLHRLFLFLITLMALFLVLRHRAWLAE
ncbi:MAG: hypothetical protein ACXWIM_19985 [Burkholderiales bacterium]